MKVEGQTPLTALVPRCDAGAGIVDINSGVTCTAKQRHDRFFCLNDPCKFLKYFDFMFLELANIFELPNNY